ncbi:MAG: hypothetical protein M3357_10185 [Actinomycetota bacterium]|nr:hypothetical protein [Actinomycetota bacterium]
MAGRSPVHFIYRSLAVDGSHPSPGLLPANRRRALVTAAGPRMRAALDCARPTFARFAAAHGYDLIVDEDVDDDPVGGNEARRRARWHKVDLLDQVLGDYDLAVWVDADAMFCAFDRDVADDIPAGCFQALVLEVLPTRFNPNSGVWALRGNAAGHRFLAEVRGVGQVEHSWSDQAALCVALGWDLGDFHGHGARPCFPSPYLAGTGWLPPEWNAVGLAARWPARIRHFAGMDMDRRVQRMRALLAHLQRRGEL